MGRQGVGGQRPPGGQTEVLVGQSSQPPLEGLETDLLGHCELAGESNSEPLSHDRLDRTGVCEGPAQSEPDPAARGSQHALHGQPQTPRRGHVIDCVCVHCLSKVEARARGPKCSYEQPWI